MSKQLRINKIYGLPITWERFDIATEIIGWNKKKFIQQITHAYFSKNGAFYVECALLDAAARGMSETDYYTALFDGGGADPSKNPLLLPYTTNERPAFKPDPLHTVPKLPTDEANIKKFNLIDMSDYYFVLLQVALIVDTGAMSQFISRMLGNHFDTYWHRSYAHQIAHHEARSFTLPE